MDEFGGAGHNDIPYGGTQSFPEYGIAGQLASTLALGKLNSHAKSGSQRIC